MFGFAIWILDNELPNLKDYVVPRVTTRVVNGVQADPVRLTKKRTKRNEPDTDT